MLASSMPIVVAVVSRSRDQIQIICIEELRVCVVVILSSPSILPSFSERFSLLSSNLELAFSRSTWCAGTNVSSLSSNGTVLVGEFIVSASKFVDICKPGKREEKKVFRRFFDPKRSECSSLLYLDGAPFKPYRRSIHLKTS